jgi:hypothetical protein
LCFFSKIKQFRRYRDDGQNVINNNYGDIWRGEIYLDSWVLAFFSNEQMLLVENQATIEVLLFSLK